MDKKLLNNKPKNFTLILYEIGSNYGKRINRIETKSSRRFRRKLNLLKPPFECFLRVSYGKKLDNYDKLTEFHNDGNYENKGDLMLAFEAFCEK